MATTLQSQLPAPPKHNLFVPKRGSLLKLVGGLMLAISFFMPALYLPKEQISHTALSIASLNLNIASGYLLVAIVPIFYILGVTTFLLVLYGRFTRGGVSRGLLVVHILEMLLVVAASGTSLVLALNFPQNQFGIFLVGPAILAWLALVIQFVATWFMRSQSLMWRVIHATQLCGALNLLLFGIIVLDTLYYPHRRVDVGLFSALAGSGLLMIGNENRRD